MEKQRAIADAALRKVNKDLPTGTTGDGFDRENAFMLYCNFSGDLSKTAVALNTTPAVIAKMASDGEWLDKLAAILKLKKSGKPGDLERGLNRTMNFVQAARTRLFLGRMLKKLSMMSDEELDKYCFAEIVEIHKDGSQSTEYKLNTRPFADLCSAMEKCHQMSYMALNDSMTERSRRTEQEDTEHSAQEIHSAIADAMAKVAKNDSPVAMLFDEQIKQSQELQRQSQLKQELKDEQAAE